MTKSLKVAVIGMQTLPSKREENLKTASKLIKKAAKKGAKLIVLPELFDSGYCVEKEDEKFANALEKSLEESPKSPTLELLSKLCKEYGIYLVGCVIEKDSTNNALYDTAFIMDSSGIVGKYRKIYLWGKEVLRFTRGQEYPVFTLDFGEFKAKVGLQICYEIGFSEGARILSLKDAEILIYPAAFGAARLYAWDLASRARALENGAFVLAANQSGSQKSQMDGSRITFAGNSQIINPKGEVLKRAKKDNQALIKTIDLQECQNQREAIPYLKDLNLALTQESLQQISQQGDLNPKT